jgi:ferredoxin/flavodoxin---NADP+ reductase
MPPSADKHFHARIRDRRDLSPDLWLLRLDPGGPFEFRAGQYATLGFERDGQRVERAYSIVSSPYEEFLEFFLELVPDGGLTPQLHKLASLSIFAAAAPATSWFPPSPALRRL